MDMSRFKLKLIALVIACVFLGGISPMYAEPHGPTPYQVKAAFIYNFTKFIDLPANAFSSDDEPISMYIVGEDPFGDAIDAIRGKVAKNRKLVVRNVSGTEKIRHCHILFISESEKPRLREILKNTEHMDALTVSDIDGFTEAGGMIGLVTVDKKIRFKVNLKAAQKAGLKISSQLLKLAVEVNGDELH
jgi:uncharacterized protein DUF4154